MPGDAGFAKGDGARGVIQQQRGAMLTWKYHAQRIGAEAAVFATERCHHRIADNVNEMDGNKPSGRALFRPVTDAPDVMRIMQRHGGQPVLARFLDA